MFNRIIALISIIILSPILLIAALGILISDWGPILFRAKRAGKNGISLGVLKFRTMRVNQSATSKITSTNDPRIFPFGKLLRLLKIDELPQLFNIIKGEMNIVGPRPEDLFIVENFYDEIMWESLNVNPGLASPGSLYNYTHVENSLNEANVEQVYINKILPLKVRMDVIYVREKSIWYDIQIVIKTIIIILQKAFGKNNFKLPTEYFKAQNI